MKTNIDGLPPDDLRFDRLVDGELSEKERRELLVGLDGEPGGWRRCALAFLESQCWKQAFGTVAQDRPPVGQVAGQLPPRRSPWPRRMGTLLAMAASFVAAFWLGSWTQQTWLGQRSIPTGSAGTTDVAIAGRPAAWPDRLQRGGPDASPQGNPASSPWRLVTLSTPANGPVPGRSIQLPAIERDSVDEQWLRSLPPAIPDEVLRALARTGHEVKQRRELVSMPLRDGRRLVAPIDQVEVRYVGNGAY